MLKAILCFLFAGFFLLACGAMTAVAADVTVKGYLVDIACGTTEGSRPNFGILHTKACLQMPECAESGYGVLLPDNSVVRFDSGGNDKAKRFIAELKKSSDVKVSVTGTRQGDNMTVSKIELE